MCLLIAGLTFTPQSCKSLCCSFWLMLHLRSCCQCLFYPQPPGSQPKVEQMLLRSYAVLGRLENAQTASTPSLTSPALAGPLDPRLNSPLPNGFCCDSHISDSSISTEVCFSAQATTGRLLSAGQTPQYLILSVTCDGHMMCLLLHKPTHPQSKL